MKKLILATVSLLFLIGASCQSQESAPDGEKVIAQNMTTENETAVQTKSENTGGAIHITAEDFKQKIMNYETNKTTWIFEGDKPCIVDFYADWCRPCKIVGPILDELAVEYAGQINVYKVDTQKERELSAMFGIQSIPAFLLCPMKGNPQMSAGIGRTPEETKAMFKKMIDEVLLNNNL